MKPARVYIVILNWNGWKDTIECLESVFRLNHDNYKVVVCDNNSSDCSLEHIKAWADGKLDAYVKENTTLRSHSFPPIAKAVPYMQYSRQEAELGGCTDDVNVPLILIQTEANLGFAGGNNVGLRYILKKNNFDYVWLLNNDTVVSKSALTELIGTIENKPHIGMCGSLLIDYHQPGYIQAAGGAFDMRLARGVHLQSGIPVTTPISETKLSEQLSYVVGASMLVTRSFLETVGLLCEDYFLFFEEIDWAMRSRDHYSLTIATTSHVYHKEGTSIGKPKDNSRSFYLYQLNRLRFTSRFYRKNILVVSLHIVGHAIKAILFGRGAMAFASLRAVTYFLFWRSK